MSPNIPDNEVISRIEVGYLEPDDVYGCACDCKDGREHEEKRLDAEAEMADIQFEEHREQARGLWR